MQVQRIRREIRLLRYYALGVTVFAGAALLGAVHEASNATFDTLTVHRINIVDRNGKMAMAITDHDDFPPPVFSGKTLKRMGGNDSNGIVFYNRHGDEQGALSWEGVRNPDGSFTSSNELAFDTVASEELLHLQDGNDNGKEYAEFIGWNRPNMLTPRAQAFINAFEGATTDAQKRALIAKYPEITAHNARRFLFGYDASNTAQVMLADAKGRPRIKMFVTADGNAQLQFLDASGKALAVYPQEGR